MNKGGFSWKRAVGITKMKQNISRKTGIPLTKSGRQRKFGAAAGCMTYIVGIFLIMGLLAFIIF